MRIRMLRIAHPDSGKDSSFIDAVYYFAFGAYALAYILSYTTLNNYQLTKFIQYASLILLFVKMLFQRFTLKSATISFVLISVGVISWIVTDDLNFLILFLFIVAGSGISIKQLASIVLVEELVIMFVVVSCSQLGLIENITQIRAGVDGDTVRYAMGYSHPNRFGSSMLAIACSFAVIQFPKFSKKDIVIYIGLALLTIAVADSRTSALMIVGVLIAAAVLSTLKTARSKKMACAIMLLVLLVLICFSLYAMCFYSASNNVLAMADNVLSGRLTLAHFYYEHFPIKVFGYVVSNLENLVSGYDNIVIDNAYAKLFILYGFVPGIIFILLYVSIFVSALKSSNITPVVFAAFIYACVGLTEWQAMHFAMNYALIGCAYLIYSNPSVERETLTLKDARYVKKD